MFFMSRSTRLVSKINWAYIGLLAKRHLNGVSLLRRADSGPRWDDGWVKAKPAVVLILKRLRKRGHGFSLIRQSGRSPGIKPGGPLVYKAYATEHVILLFVFLCPGAPEGSTGSGSGFKASQKTGHRFKSH